jgi:general secretion pathway protein A
MYLDYYGLSKQPFSISPDPDFIWFSSRHEEAFTTLKYGIEEDKGFLVLTGDVGTGKTLLIKNLEKKIPIPTIIVTVPDPDMKPLEFFHFFAEEVQMNKKFKSKGEFLIHLKNFLLEAFGAHKKVLLILDEAQRLNHRLLEEIRLLSNLEMTNRKLINIFFVGQNEFTDMLNDDRSKAVRQRITVGYHLDPLTEAETASYIEHRLKVAGTTNQIFSRDAIEEIYNFSQGYPRLINILCDNALRHGSSKELRRLNSDIIREVAKELPIPEALIKNNGGQKKEKGPEEKAVVFEAPASVDVEENKIEEPLDKVIAEQDCRQANNETPKVGAIPEPPEIAEARKPLASLRYAVVAFLIGLFGISAYFFYNYRSNSDSRWSMEDIAPKKEFKISETPESSLEQKESGQMNAEKEKSIVPETLLAAKEDKPEKSNAIVLKKAEPKAQEKEFIAEQIPKETIVKKGIDASSAEKTPTPETRPSVAPSAMALPAEPMSEESIEKKDTDENSSGKIPAPKTDFSLAVSAKTFPKDKIILHFPFNSIILPEQYLTTLDQIVEFAAELPDAEITVEGYTDASGNFWYNQKLSQARANAIKNYFVEQGIDPSRIKAVGMGSEAPIDDNETPEGRSRNRRVEIKLNNKDI